MPLFRSWFLAALLLLTTLPFAVNATDTGTSHNLFILDRLDDKWFFVGRANLVTRDGTADTFFGYVDANARYSIDKNWAIEAGYRQAYLELPSGTRTEYRPMFALYWRHLGDNWKFSNRNRLELRYFEGNAKDRVRYRNESVLTSKHTITSLELTPFIEEEFFYDLTDSELNINWLTAGVSKFWTKNFKWKLGYRLQSQKFGGEWQTRNVLVTGISYIDFEL